jgi:hypothetical protein
MRTATLPAVRTTEDVRALVESVLREGETLSSFVEDSVRERARMRQEDEEFYARGLRASQLVKEGKMRTYSLEEVMASLRKITADAKKAKAKKTDSASSEKSKLKAMLSKS